MIENELPDRWHRLSQQSAEQFAVALQQELCPEHVLYKVPVQAFARLDQRDDFLFRIPEGYFAKVHLTWTYQSDPLWPSTDLFSSLVDWKKFLEEDDLDCHPADVF